MTGSLTTQAAVLITMFGLISAACVGFRLRRVRPSVAVLTDFLVAAGLLRLTGRPSWTSLATASAVIGVRLMVGSGLRARPRSVRRPST
ncbi:hypothetical protein LO772_00655 [Yinghuangia sp. ASG 101]|uniref:hypothetical protein n=1 Tax=Yinghuangia sp. ASG 101 TaxID=2896848 RepID=UPI001E5D0BDB|nr:hypothetical protein [Yinghuangia sp. ASG 101]UGQ12154.1 hypothetical protein LO772_00655 [Yinghuangia sp. ASG 101]